MDFTLFKKEDNIYSIILCGGSGTRLWPLSRKIRPKQFLSFGGTKKSLLQLAVDRIKNISLLQQRWIVTTKEQESLCKTLVSQDVAKMIVEPVPRNTAPAIALAAWRLMQENPDSIMLILSSDHVIQNVRSFEQTISDAVELAKQDFFVTVGIKPTYAATGFGYIEQGLPLDKKGNILSFQNSSEKTASAYAVRSFREKPNHAAAEQFLRTKRYLWNAGIFIWKTKTFWEAFSKLHPEIVEVIKSMDDKNFMESYAKLDNVPIDTAFIEQISHAACVPANFDWDDVGTWSAVRECFEQDSSGNTVAGENFVYETQNSVIHTTGPFVAVIGMENIAVIATGDAVLVMPLARSQEVKKVVQFLEQDHKELL